MDIEFKDISGNRVGLIVGADVKDNYGNRVGYIIDGIEIRDSNGNRPGIINGNDLYDNYGNRIGYLSVNEIRDSYGNIVGRPITGASEIEIAAAAFLLFNLEPESTQKVINSSEEKSSCPEVIIWIIGLFKLFFNYFKGNAFSLKGTANRSEWWKKCFSSIWLMFVCYMVFGIILLSANTQMNIFIIVFSILFLIIHIPVIATSVRRMHDIGRCGWWYIIPIFGFFLCAFFPGKIDEDQKYAKEEKGAILIVIPVLLVLLLLTGFFINKNFQNNSVVQKNNTVTTVNESSNSKKMYVNATSGLRVRSLPSTDSERLGLLDHLIEVDVIKEGNIEIINGVRGKWVYINSPMEGWVYSGFLLFHRLENFNFKGNLLTDQDLRGLSKAQLRILRNTIFAQHGRIFASEDLQNYFSSKEWYRPLYNNVDHLFNEVEKRNIEIIQSYE